MARARNKSVTDDRQIAVYVRKSKITETGKSIEIQKEKCIARACSLYEISETDCLIYAVGSKEPQVDMDKADILVYEDDGKSGFFADRPMYGLGDKSLTKKRIKHQNLG